LAVHQVSEEFDENHDGMLDKEEYLRVVHSSKGRMYLNLMGLEPRHTDVLFKELKAINRDDAVPLDEFVKGCTRMRGIPCNLDMRALQCEIGVLREEFRSFANSRHVAKRKARAVSKQVSQTGSYSASGTASQTVSHTGSAPISHTGSAPMAPTPLAQAILSQHGVDAGPLSSNGFSSQYLAHAKHVMTGLPKISSSDSSRLESL